MLQLRSRAQAPAGACRLVKATTALLGAAALLAAMPDAGAQMSRAAAIGVWRAATSTFALDGDYDNVADATVAFGQAGDFPLLGDIGGSGARGTVVYRNGVWLFDLDRDGVPDKTVTWGAASDVPLMADVDADGKDDLVLYRSGMWLVNTKADGTLQYTFQFGGSRGDVPVVGDVNGDGQVDLIVYNRGSWHVSFNRDNRISLSVAHGAGSGETPLAFDYDGDGKAELVVFANGVWSVKSVNGPPQTASFTFGGAGDRPLYFGPGMKPDPVLDAARFLNGVTFGATESQVTRALSMGYVAYVDEQLAMAHSPLPYMAWYPQSRPQTPTGQTWPYCVYASYAYGVPYSSATPCNCNAQAGTVNQCQRDVYSNFRLQNELFKRAVAAPDQLRHRVAWALSQILVTSNVQDPIAYPMRNYQQWLLDLAFGNFEAILYAITLSPWMGNYLDMVRNDGSPAAQAAGVVPNENYARELLQLFSIGLWELKNDGTLLLDAQGNPIPTYDQDDIVELSRALTGWAYPPQPGQTATFTRGVNYIGDMVPIEGPINATGSTNYHDVGAKAVMGVAQPAGTRAEADVRWAVQLAANHPNTGVYIGRQLIQQLVTSNPSPAYVNRVVAVWNNNGQGIRGDLRAVVRAILLDWEAVKPRNPVLSIHGKLKEPVLYIGNFMRSIGGTTDGVYLRSPSASMGQNVYNSPTVFNYYQQDYLLPGTTLSAPPFQIFDATSYFARANFVYNLVYNTTCDTGTPSSPQTCGPAPDATVFGAIGTQINWASLKAQATDPAMLVDVVSQKLLFTALPKALRTQAINAVAAVPVSVPMTQTQRLDRVRMAVYLVAVSPQYQVGF